MTKEKSKIGLIFRGVAMGIAEVIPGVSGGTIAFITGIYEQLIDSIKSIGPEAYQGFREGGVRGLWTSINGDFIVWLLLGMLGGLVVGIFGVTYLMEHYPVPLWAFFFGLILASAIYMARQITKWSVSTIGAIVVGAVVAYMITMMAPSQGSTSLLYVFLSGMIAISALMLPGISGSFILLIMGMYTIIIPMIKDTIKTFNTANLVTLGVFGVGCLVGLVGFSRVLSWLFKSYKEPTFALLTGFLLGALNKIWPWRNVTDILNKETGKMEHLSTSLADHLDGVDPEHIKIIAEANVLPMEYNGGVPMIGMSALCFFIGLGLVYLLDRFDEK